MGCGRSDPNEPVSEKPLYDYLWPKDIEEEDDKVHFSIQIFSLLSWRFFGVISGPGHGLKLL